MKQNHVKGSFWIVSLWTILFAMGACASKATPPGADVIFGSLTAPQGFGGSYTVLQWKEGLSISIIDNSQGAHESSSSGSTEDPVWIGQGSIGSQNGQDVIWRVATTDGKTAQFFINEESYDLSQGTLFLIKTNLGSPQIMQPQSSHNGPCSDGESCQEILKQDPAVLQFMQETLQHVATPVIEAVPTVPSSAATGGAPIHAGWMTHTSQQCEYEIRHPAEMQVQSQTPYSDLLLFNLPNPDEGARNFIYVSVIAPEIKRMAEQGVYNHDVYNYDPVAIETLLSMQVGESKSVHVSLDLASGFTYHRQPDTMISGYAAQAYENLRPWEFPEGTKEVRYYLSLDRCTYLIGGYMDIAGLTQAGVITEELFEQIVATIQLIP